MSSWTDAAPPPGWAIGTTWRFVNLGVCRGCRESIAWCEHVVTGRRSPLDRDGRSHFATCPNAQQFRR